MKTQSMLLAAMASVPAALAHTVFTEFSVNGMPQGAGVAMRMSNVASAAGSPIASLDSDDMACNVGGTKGVSRVQNVPDGALLSFQIHSWADDPTQQPLDRGHKGPCAVYAKKVSSAIEDQGAGDGWFKIFDYGYEKDADRWCSDEIIDNNGLLNVNLPKGLAGGAYLIRPEILALHNADKGEPQFYTGCAQINLESTGNLGPESTVKIPGYVAYGQPSTSFNIWDPKPFKKDYVIPGPAVAKLVATSSTASTKSVEGAKPEGCIVENANWCGKEVASYTTETGCGAASKDCWAQHKLCWSSAPPTGGKGCELMEKRCTSIDDSCSAKSFPGPPNAGKILTPEVSKQDVGKILPTAGGAAYDSAPPAQSNVAAPSAASKTPTPSPAQTTFAVAVSSARAPLPTWGNKNTQKENDSEPQQPELHVTVPAAAPATPTQTCPKGYKCITHTQVATVTQMVYVTQAADAKRGAAALHRRRRVHHV